MLLSGVIAEQQSSLAANRRGSLSVTEEGDILAAIGLLRISGALAITEEGDTVVALAIPPNTADVTVTEDDDVLDSSGANLPPILGSLDKIEESDSISATGEINNQELREDGFRELREDGTIELRE